MDACFEQGRTATLGAYVVGLLPGCACVCCGASLREVGVGPGAESPGARTTPAPKRPTIVMCPNCGCEVAELVAGEAAAVAA